MSTRSVPLLVMRRALIIAAPALIMGCGAKNPISGMSALPPTLNAAAPLINSVSASVPGLSQAQTMLGLGSVFGLAQQKLPPEQYNEVASAVPGANELASEATRLGLPKQLKGMSDVVNYLNKAGVTPDQLGKMVSSLGEHMGPKVSPSAATAFFNALR
jgi:uncharacterized protein VcgC/VcgE DUF2780